MSEQITLIILEDEGIAQYADGTMICKGCGQPMTFDGALLGKFNQYTCYTINCPAGDRLTRCGDLVPVANDHQDRKLIWRRATGNAR